MGFFKAYGRALRQSWFYGIGYDLTPRERRMWRTMLYVLATSATYYQLKDIARENTEGHFGLTDVKKFYFGPWDEEHWAKILGESPNFHPEGPIDEATARHFTTP